MLVHSFYFPLFFPLSKKWLKLLILFRKSILSILSPLLGIHTHKHHQKNYDQKNGRKKGKNYNLLLINIYKKNIYVYV